MRKLIAAAAMLGLAACNQGGSGGMASATPRTDEEKTFYALGLQVGKKLQELHPSQQEVRMMEAGVSDAIFGKPQVEMAQWAGRVQQLASQRATARAQEQKNKDKPYYDKMAQEAGVQKSPSGLLYLEEKPGTGDQPKQTDVVKVNYRGTLTDGTEFDSSYKRNQPVEFPLNRVIPCWTEGLQKMKVGGKAKIVCPSSIGYGDRPTPTIPPGSTLTFEVELLETKAAPTPMMPNRPGMPPNAMMRPLPDGGHIMMPMPQMPHAMPRPMPRPMMPGQTQTPPPSPQSK